MVQDFYDDTIFDPIVAGDYFSISWTTDLQMKRRMVKALHQHTTKTVYSF